MKYRFPFLVVGLVLVAGCGKNSDKKTTTLSAISLPSIDFAIPGTSATLGLTTNADILLDTQERVNERITKLNADLVKWNTEFTEVGVFKAKGPNKDKSGSLTEVNDGTYKYKLIVCEGGNLHMVVKWSADNKNVYSWRNQRYKPEPEISSILMQYTETAAGKTFSQKFFGVKDKGPADEVGTNLADYITASETAAGVFTFSGVQDFSITDLATYTSAANSGDAYIVGQLSTDGTSGQAVTFRAGATNGGSSCGSSFTESTPNWCKARVIGQTTAASTTTVWSNLSTTYSLAVASSSLLGDPTETETCPE